MSFVSTELLAHTVAMKNPSADKVLALQHALEVNADPLVQDRVCMYRACYHHASQHGTSWKTGEGAKRKRCRCKHLRTM